jgi:hypothetical protein
MTIIRACSSVLLVCALLAGCQGHLPTLDSYPKSSRTPKVTDVVNHIQCELAQIVNGPYGSDSELGRRIQNNDDIEKLLPNLVKYNFVATAQITLEVTDAEGLTPSLSFMNAAATHVVGVGGQWNGTQDRTVTLNYAIDLKQLNGKRDEFCAGSSSESDKSGLQGNLGLPDIVADGLLSLDRSAKANVYPSTGPAPASVARAINQIGTVVLPPLVAGGAETQIAVQSLKGTMLFAPQSAGVQTQGTVTLSGLATLNDGHQYVVNWTGSIIPPNSVTGGGNVYFTLTGSLVPDPNGNLTQIEKRWGFGPTVTLTGMVNSSFQAASLVLSGVIAPVAGSDYAKAGLPPVRIELPTSNPPHGGAAAGGPAAKGGGSSASGGSGGTSFGSLIDFVLVYGLNGSPSFTFKNVKGVSGGSNPFVNWTRTKTDSLAITFVAACQDSAMNVTSKSYWDSIGVCDELAAARQEGASVGYQNNSLMILRNFLVRPQ